VDDDDAVAKGFARVLGLSGCETQWACNGLVALEMLEQSRFDAMVTDVFMPEREGLETICEVRKSYPAMGIVVVSGGSSVIDASTFLKLGLAFGAVAALLKPVSSEDLLRAVRLAIAGPIVHAT
jgi:CheY-like chemotaxis protein